MPSLITPSEARARTGLSRSVMYDLIAKGKHPKPVYPGGPKSPRFVAEEIDAFIQKAIKARGNPSRRT